MCILKGKEGKAAYLEEDISESISVADGESAFRVKFVWNEEIGVPGAIFVKNETDHEFYLRNVSLKNIPGHGNVHFHCNSWVYPSHLYHKDRIFFTNKVILLSHLCSNDA